MRRVRGVRLVLALVILAHGFPAPAWAWNRTGHRVTAWIAYQALDPSTRQRVVESLKAHPAYADWAQRGDSSGDPGLDLFMHAAYFADEARREPYRAYHNGPAHYVNFPIRIDENGGMILGDEVPPGVNILNAFEANLKTVRDTCAAPADRALALSWIFHQGGDIHQPLHSVARFAPATPNGDRGGNEVKFPDARGGRSNLHAYWDGLGGYDDAAEAVKGLAHELVAEYPRCGFGDELARPTIEEWAREGQRLAAQVVYRNLDPTITDFPEIPVAYEADARRTARRQLTLAGYRLADTLKGLFPPAP